jgi:insulysin
MAQYAVVAKLFGYVFAPRPPDAIELAFDAQVHGLSAVQSGRWYRFPSSDDRGGLGLNPLRRSLSETLIMMSNPANAVMIITAGEKTASASRSAVLSETLPPLSSGRWITEPVSGARIIFEDFLQFKSISKQVLTRIINREELIKPLFNPLIPTTLLLATAERSSTQLATRDSSSMLNERSDLTTGRNSRTVRWKLLDPMPGEVDRLLPRGPPEPGIRCVFVMEFLSPRPARANVRQAARAELWKLAFEMALSDLAELGASGGLAYEVSFNKFGLRLSFLGIRQTIPSYTRRIARVLAGLHNELLDGPETLPREITSSAISTASKVPGLSPARRRLLISNLRSSTAYEAASEGLSFLRSVTGVIAFGDGLSRSSLMGLVGDVQDILKKSMGNSVQNLSTSTTIPTVSDLVYKPTWKPRYASSCSISGASLISNACGRIPR